MTPTSERLAAALLTRVPTAQVLRLCAAPWRSATFAGLRHVVVLSVADAAEAAYLLDGLDEQEFVLPGAIVADISGEAPVAEGGRLRVGIEALTIEDA